VTLHDVYEKFAEQASNVQRETGQCAALGAGYAAHPASFEPSPLQVIEFLTVQLGAAVKERNDLRGRVWQLDQVNTTHLMRRQEMCDALVELRQEVSRLQKQVADSAPQKQISVVGCFGANARVERPMEQLSCASANGKTVIRVDARVKRRKRAQTVG
jgi:hypothetical protein